MILRFNPVVNALRRRLRRWSQEGDRHFHDQLFAGTYRNPFTFSYSGYLTIRRFADLVEPLLEGAERVLDLGCGPAEITCELARRLPNCSFRGVDHSDAALERARRNAEALRLENITFTREDAGSFEPEPSVDVVLMFDSFHHLTDPQAFVARMARRVDRFVLIEPRGDWKGAHDRTLDFDWLLGDMERIRQHVALQVGDWAGPPVPEDVPRQSPEGEAVENRYTLEQFRAFFSGFGLRLKGTVCGFDTYPPEPYADTPTRHLFGRYTYELLQRLDGLIQERGQGVLAKHWVLCLDRSLPSEEIPVPQVLPPGRMECPDHPRGPYEVSFCSYEGPRSVPAGAHFQGLIGLRNSGIRSLCSTDADHPDFISYHWLDRHGVPCAEEGLRSPLAHIVEPDAVYQGMVRIKAPVRPGRYRLALDMVCEGRTWFSQAGNPWMTVAIKVRKA